MSQSRSDKVSIITVNFNQTEVTCALLESLRQLTYPNFEVIIVDNGSVKDNPEPIAARYPEFKLIKSPVNLGFAGGNNLGVKSAEGDFLMFLNNDTEVDPGFLEPLVAKLESDKKIGMVSPKIRFHHTPDTIQYAGYTPLSKITLRQRLIGFREKDTGQYDQGSETFSIHGAAMMIPRRVIDEVGIMAEMFFLYYEEHDWAMRVKKAGYTIHYVPQSLVLHKESISTGKESPLKAYYINRNRFLFARRNLTGIRRVASLAYLSAIAFPKGLLTYLIERRYDLAKSVLRAYLWNFTHFSKSQRQQFLD
jgi:GT2 family glycosyltransferase